LNLEFGITYGLWPLSVLYGAATRARVSLYQKGFFKAQDLGAPVVSIGNITVGGTGKTPLVAWVANTLVQMEKKVCILTRGYGRANISERAIVSDGKKILANPETGGDEPLLLAEMLLGKAAVISDKERASAGRWARENLGCDAFVLDDGFQHWQVNRDFDIVCVDATSPFGNGKLLPSGRLREPLSSLQRADCIIITKTDLVQEAETIRAEVETRSKGRPVFLSRFRWTQARHVKDNSSLDLKDLPQPVAAFCALGNPQAFFIQARNTGATVVHTQTFKDHHAYTQADIERIEREAKEQGANSLLTTTKDAVKLRALSFEMPCYALEIEVEIDEEEILRTMLLVAIKRHPPPPQ
jgi:tetraacyldisaccharide 4'-kinase